MTEKPIIFSTDMVKAILTGRKTQTRRVIKNPPSMAEGARVSMLRPLGHSPSPLHAVWSHPSLGNFKCQSRNSPYEPGSLLWVRESWNYAPRLPNLQQDIILYKADFPDPALAKWKPSIHLKKAHARLWLRVSRVWVERIQDISSEDIVAEGVGVPLEGVEPRLVAAQEAHNRLQFRVMWNDINFKRGFGWNTNPWVWCVEFQTEK